MRNAIARRKSVRPGQILPGFYGHRAVLTAAVLGVLSSASWAAPVQYRTVLLSGSRVPDAAGSTTASLAADSIFGPRATDSSTTTGFTSLSINQNGHVAAVANLTNGVAGGTSVTNANSRGIWSEGADGVLRQVARQGDLAPDSAGAGITGIVYGSTFVGPNINASGYTAFTGNLTTTSLGTDLISTGATANNNGIFLNPLDSTRMLLRKGTAATGLPSQIYQGVGASPVMNSTGTIAVALPVGVTSTFISGTNSVYTISPAGTVTRILSGGDLAPGIESSGVTATFSSASGAIGAQPAMNSSGDLAIKAQLISGAAGVTASSDMTLWSTKGGLHLVAREGSSAPGTSSTFGNNLGGLSLGFNDAGYLAFSNTVAAGQAGIWKGSDTSNVALVALAGATVPSSFVGVSGVTYSAFGTSPVINHDNYVAYTASLTDGSVNIGTGVNNTALFAQGASGLRMVARAGDAVPGATSLYFSGTSASSAAVSTSTQIQMNLEGAVAFLAALSSTQYGASTGTGLFAEDDTGTLRLVVQTGQNYDVGPGDTRTITSITYGNGSGVSTGGEDSRTLSWTDTYQVVYQLRFTDGSSGVFVGVVPEPSSLGLMFGAGALLLRRRRTR